MKCFRCAKEVEQDEKYCPYCGTTTDPVRYYEKRSKEDSSSSELFDFIGGAFRLYIKLSIVFSIVMVILSAMLGNAIGGDVGKSVLGTMIGFVVGVVGVVVANGLIVTFVQIADHLRFIRDDIDKKNRDTYMAQ